MRVKSQTFKKTLVVPSHLVLKVFDHLRPLRLGGDRSFLDGIHREGGHHLQPALLRCFEEGGVVGSDVPSVHTKRIRAFKHVQAGRKLLLEGGATN